MNEDNQTPDPGLHAYVICWSGMESSARAIAEAVSRVADSTTVIYSNRNQEDLHGPGRWVRVPDEWFYGRKFEHCLKLHRNGIMLQIQADASFYDWPQLVRRCRDVHRRHPNTGVWGAEVHYTPWDTEIVKTGVLADNDLVLVAHTDGIVWSLAMGVIERLGQFRYDDNNLGWGLDWLAACCARTRNLLVIRDLSLTVQHPPGTGYNHQLAEAQMKKFLLQMTVQEGEHYDLLNAFVGQRIRAREVPRAITSFAHQHSASDNDNPGRLMDWPARRAAELGARLRALLEKPSICFTFQSGIPATIYRYFPASLAAELAKWSPDPFRFVPPEDRDASPDVVILTAHANDLHQRIWELRESYGTDPVMIAWMWDNHTSYVDNKAVAFSSDLVMPAHSSTVNYLFNPAGVVSSHIPLCCAQWTREQAEEFFAAHGASERRTSLLVNYVEYHYAPDRNAVIRDIAANIPQADVLLMPSHDRSRYFSRSAEDNFREWAAYTSTIILPVTDDLSTRFFDALLAGLIPIVPRSIVDVARIGTPEQLNDLGVVLIDSLDIDEIKAATLESFDRFHRMGYAGIVARHRFVLEHHMLVNRVTDMLHTVFLHANGQLKISFGAGPFGTALYQTANDA